MLRLSTFVDDFLKSNSFTACDEQSFFNLSSCTSQRGTTLSSRLGKEIGAGEFLLLLTRVAVG